MIEKIIDILKDRPVSVTEICRELKLLDKSSKKQVLRNVEKIRRICKRKGWKLNIIPARCKRCGYIFNRDIKIPSKCPNCLSERIEEPRFYIDQ